MISSNGFTHLIIYLDPLFDGLSAHTIKDTFPSWERIRFLMLKLVHRTISKLICKQCACVPLSWFIFLLSYPSFHRLSWLSDRVNILIDPSIGPWNKCLIHISLFGWTLASHILKIHLLQNQREEKILWLLEFKAVGEAMNQVWGAES